MLRHPPAHFTPGEQINDHGYVQSALTYPDVG
jgi:hypothetical protein